MKVVGKISKLAKEEIFFQKLYKARLQKCDFQINFFEFSSNHPQSLGPIDSKPFKSSRRY